MGCSRRKLRASFEARKYAVSVSEVKEKRNLEYYMIEAFGRLLCILIPLLKCKRGCIPPLQSSCVWIMSDNLLLA